MNEKIYKTYSEQEIHKATLEYFNGDELAADVWKNKYCLKDGKNYYELTPDDMHRRIAKELARIEAKYPNPLPEDKIYETLKFFKRIIPQGSPMSGIGNNFQVVSLGNCFVIGNEIDSDSYGGIMKLDQEIAQLQKRRGGVGLDISFIRPTGSPVKNSAITSTGVVPFMERFSNTTREVAQDGRRGALLQSISIKHPDAEDFIDAKMTQGKVTGANISVRITDEFMKSAIEGETFTQQYPIDAKEPKYIKEINAQKLWKKIVYNAWKSAEPGILFWDTIIRESIPDCYADFGFETVSTNPCVSENTLILTDNGYFRIVDKLNQKIRVWNGKEFSEVIPSITGYNQKMMKITFSDGSELECTPYHGFYTWEGFERDGNSVKKEAKDLIVGDKLEKHEFPTLIKNKINDTDKSFYTLGFFAGDGFINRNSTTHISLYGEKKNLLDKLDVIGNTSESIENDRITIRVQLPNINETDLHKIKKYVPKYQNNHTPSMMSWLGGIIDSDGSRNSEEGSISISSIDRNFLMDIKLHVLNVFGVNGSVIDEKEGGLHEIKGIEYNCNKSYRLIISAFNVKKLYDLGLRTYRVTIDDVNPNRNASRFITVKSIEEIENAEIVYCFTEEKRGRGCFNGVVTANCGEITLCKSDSCRLLSLNLFSYIINPFTKDAYFNWELFIGDVQIAMRYMDDIVDLELEKIDAILAKIESDPEDENIKLYEINLWKKIREKTVMGRRTGLGITAEGDMLAALGYRYGTDKATEFSVMVHKTLKLNAYRSSVTMAKERGAFPIYDSAKETHNPFINRIKDEDLQLYADMITYGRRNIALLTLAPTGTVSLMTQTTSGIEPAFLPVYMRRRKINPQEKDIRIDFVDDEGIAWQEYPVFHHKFEMWLEINGYDINIIKTMKKEQLDEIVKQSPYYKATSNDVDWVKKVEMQGRIQKHVDHSISVTVNLPENVTEEIVDDVYTTGWRNGCKGITVYRDKSRSGVLVGMEDNKKDAEFKEIHAPKRPKRLKGEIHRFQNNLEKWIAVVGLKDGRPYEVFTGKLENGLSNLPNNIKECEVVKNIIETEELNEHGELIFIRKKRYDIEYVDNNGEKQVHTGLNHAFNPEFWNYAKLFSSVLRHGMPIIYVYQLIDSLNLNDDNLNTWKNGVARVIKRYIKDGEKGKGKCPECGSEHLEYKEGCLTCMSCGFSKCG
jgi:ribonucleotide reductase alpha subunit